MSYLNQPGVFSAEAAGTISQGRAVKWNASGQVIQCTVDGEQACGVALEDAVSGGILAVAGEGARIDIGSADGVITPGTHYFVKTAADGQLAAMTASADSGKFYVAQPIFNERQAAAAANDTIEAIVSIGQLTSTTAGADITALQTDVTRLEGRDLYMTLTPGVEAANAIPVLVSQFDTNGAVDAAARNFIASLYDANGLESLVAAATITAGAGCAATSTDARPRLFCASLGTGTFSLTVTDVTGALAGTLYLVVEMVSQDGSKCQTARTALVFA